MTNKEKAEVIYNGLFTNEKYTLVEITKIYQFCLDVKDGAENQKIVDYWYNEATK